jgi:hypothetical protein
MNVPKFSKQEFTAMGYRDLFSWAEKESEIEFLRVIDHTVVPIEVKSGERTKAKSLLVYKNKYSLERGIKITAKNIQRENKQAHNYPLNLARKIK